MSEISAERYDRDAYRIVSGKIVVGMILRHCDDLWSINSPQERRLTKRRFRNVKAALAFAKAELLADLLA